jgi:basic membrane protein A
MVKRVDIAVFDTVQAATNGQWPGGEVKAYGLAEGGVDLAPFGRFDSVVPQTVKDAADQARQAIIDGEVQVPSTRG